MKKNINKYCSKVQKETEKVLYKMFGEKKSIKEYIAEKEKIRHGIENEFRKPLEQIPMGDLRLHLMMGSYARYRTLDKLLKIYEESVCLSLTNN